MTTFILENIKKQFTSFWLFVAFFLAVFVRSRRPDCQIGISTGQPLPGSLYGRFGRAGDARPCLVFVFGGGFIAGERDAERYLPFFHYMVNQGTTWYRSTIVLV